MYRKPKPSEHFWYLIKRMIALGALLPQGDAIDRDIAFEDPETRANAKVVLAEFQKVQAQLDAEIATVRKRRVAAEAAEAAAKKRK